ncbi:MAG: type II toxin-antitoxin system Phd/YefM family antitoxin [Deltaproteobacteria bacterium]|nr:type II toxin-antitoxin system Phd/YefM family antitoxin [Deltaproteobacteria bacterium]
MPRMTMTAARRELPEAVNKLVYGNGEPIVLSRRGKDLAAIVPIEDLQLIEELKDRMLSEKAKRALKEKGRIPWGKIKKDLGL